jgi:virginiamycin A acetyltransferase
MKIADRIIEKLIYRIENYNKIRTNTNDWHGEKLILKKSAIIGDVKIGSGCKIIDGVQIHAGSPVRVGHYTSINGPNTDIFARINPVTIGNFCSIARNVSIQEYNHCSNRLTSYFVLHNIFGESIKNDIESKGAIEIGHDVWIGAQCVILSGSKIGNGAIIAANSVVTGTIPDFAIAGGSPAKVIKYRFSDEVISELKKLQWWNWSIDRIRRNRHLFENEMVAEKIKDVQE